MNKIFLMLMSAALLTACKKEAGEGGNSSIRGVIDKDVRIVLTNPDTYLHTLPAAEQDVYIVYGDHISPDDRIETNYDGEFEFLFLRPGKYTIYVYSEDTTGVSTADPDHMVISREVEITDRKQTLEIEPITIYEAY